MTLSTEIINDLHVGPSTAHALADRMNKSPEAIRMQLERMEKAGEVLSRPICDGKLTVWHIRKNAATHTPGANEKPLK
jgi:hypothetical protein